MNQTMERIEQLRESRNLKAYQLCDAIHLRQNTYTTWKKRDTSPDTDTIILLADYFNVSTDYLLRGIDVGTEIFGETQATLLRIFNGLNDTGKQELMDYAEFLSQRY